jgi:hypothetical protein
MYGQLTAIAREFNFPSPVGLCLYLHVTEQGISIARRISWYANLSMGCDQMIPTNVLYAEMSHYHRLKPTYLDLSAVTFARTS